MRLRYGVLTINPLKAIGSLIAAGIAYHLHGLLGVVLVAFLTLTEDFN